jgi:hypothetical protein
MSFRRLRKIVAVLWLNQRKGREPMKFPSLFEFRKILILIIFV